jgi:3-deoxy-manno-octulosonate cytidylyltransferase (CMP-KDO synthetase)
MDSKRLPGKPLLMVRGKALLHYVYDQAKRTSADHVVVTAPDREIGQYCSDHGLTFFPSSSEFENGTQRCADIAAKMAKKIGPDFVIVNWQVDEPMVWSSDVDKLIHATASNAIGTLVYPIAPKDLTNPHVVKVAVTVSHDCLWFSRGSMLVRHGHTGIYCYSDMILSMLADLETTQAARDESLEQLTWLENGFEIREATLQLTAPLSINTVDDWNRFVQIVENGHADN